MPQLLNRSTVQPTWQVSPFTVWRTTGLSNDLIQDLRFPLTVHRLDTVDQALHELNIHMERLADHLTLEVQHAATTELRRALINVRRQLHSHQVPKPRDLAYLTEHWTSPWKAALLGLSETQRRLSQEVEQLDAVLWGEYHTQQATLRQRIRAAPDFRAALHSVAPDLALSVDAYLDSPPAASLSQWRKLELSLYTYLTRAAFKTSPLSRFTFTSLTDHHRVGPLQAELRAVRSAAQLHAGTLHRLFEAVTSHPELRAGQQFRLNPDHRSDGNRLSLFQRQRSASGDLRDRRITLRLTPALSQLLTFLNERPAASATVLASALRLPDADRIWAWVDAGLLVPEVSISDHHEQPYQALGAYLQRLGTPLACTATHLLDDLEQTLGTYALIVDGRAAASQRVEQTCTALFALLGVEAALPPHSRLIVENATVEVHAPTLPGLLQADAPELQAAARLAHLFNLQLTPALKQVGTFVQQFGVGGQCPDPEHFLRQAQDTWPPSASPYVITLKSMDQQVDAQRNEVLDQLYTQFRCGTGQDLVMSGDEIPQPPLPQAVDLLLQATGEAQDVVLNGAMFGQYNALCRAWGLLEDQPAFQALMRRQSQSKRAAAQLVVGSQSNINTVPIRYAHAVYAPGTPMHADWTPSPQSAWRLSQLTLEHDPQRHRLQFRTPQGQVLDPHFVGTFATHFLPRVDQALVRLSPAVVASFPLAMLLYARLPEEEVTAVTFIPRVRCGRVVVSRASWVLQAAQPWKRAAREPELAYWRRLRSQWLASSLPEQFYALPAQRQDPHALQVEGPVKPQLFMLDSFFGLRSFERWLDDTAGTLLIQEPLPQPGRSGVQFGGEPRTCELSVHLDPHQEDDDVR